MEFSLPERVLTCKCLVHFLSVLTSFNFPLKSERTICADFNLRELRIKFNTIGECDMKNATAEKELALKEIVDTAVGGRFIEDASRSLMRSWAH